MKHLFIFLTVSLTSCDLRNKNIASVEEDEITKKETEIFGDTLKIIYEYRGDTIVQHRIDLKGTSDDGWDNSVTIKSIWSTRIPMDLNCKETLILNYGKIDFLFCYDEVFHKIADDMSNDFVDSIYLAEIKRDLVKYKNKQVDTLSVDMFQFAFRLLRSINFSVKDNQKKARVSKVKIEQYETGFSGGRNYFFIGNKKDTLAKFFVNEWMR